MAALSICQVSAQAATWYVDDSATGTNAGTSWANAYTDLQSAITSSSSGDEVWVAAGTYKPSVPASPSARSATFALKNGVTFWGGFAGGETLRSQRDWVNNVTILSGDIGTVGVATDNVYTIVTSTNVATTLDGFTVRDAYSEYGGLGPATAIKQTAFAAFVVSNCIIRDNYSTNSPGGMSMSHSCTLSYCDFIDNTAVSANSGVANGGGLSISAFNGNSVTVDHCTFTGNSANNAGGGVSASLNGGGAITFTDCDFTSNSASTGGGLASVSGALVLTRCSITYNSADSASLAIGGGVSAPDTITATDCVFDYNTVDHGFGGGLYCRGATLDRCSFSYNEAGHSSATGGGIYYTFRNGYGGKISNCRIVGNAAAANYPAVAIQNQGGTENVVMVNCTVSDNSSAAGNYAVGALSSLSSNTFAIRNSILWGDNGLTEINSASLLTVTYSDIQGGYTGTGNSNSDPLFIDPSSDDYALDTGSPAIDVGNDSLVIGSYDLLQADRVLDVGGVGNSGTNVVDLGCYEVQE